MLVQELLRLVDLFDERGVGAAGGEAVGVWLIIVVMQTLEVDSRVWPGDGADSRVEADVLVVQDEGNKGVCVETVAV